MHITALMIFGIVVGYLSVGFVLGTLAGRLAYRRFTGYNQHNMVLGWAWWTFFCWPAILVGFTLAGLGFGVFKIVDHVIVPKEIK